MHIEVFQSSKSVIAPKAPQRWYWRFKNKGRITADAESFPTKAHAVRAAKAVVRAVIKEYGVGVPVEFETAATPRTAGPMTIIRWG